MQASGGRIQQRAGDNKRIAISGQVVNISWAGRWQYHFDFVSSTSILAGTL
jgi:hypothetical protein